MFRSHFETDGEEVVARIFRTAKGKNENQALRAAELILDRLLGRPRQSIEMDVSSPDFIPPETVYSRIAERLSKHPAAAREVQKLAGKV